jgi:serine phosphatase RsbU (regulator of sigma subunit)
LPGRVWGSGEPEWTTAVPEDAPLRSACAFPILVDGSVYAIIEMMSFELHECEEELLVALADMGRHVGSVIEQSNARDQLRVGELHAARHIQTALLPRDLTVECLEVAATMVPADEVGGDYYDVLPFPGGAWLGIGDVTGHGVGAGMIMLMVQSAVASMTIDPARDSPAEVVKQLNTFLYNNVRRRLREDDHVTFTLLRYTRDGVVRFAGRHEELIVWRTKTRTCEVVETSGAWLGAARSVADITKDEKIQLLPGDLLVLYTDGVIEARNAAREQFGFDRFCDLVSELAKSGRSAAQLCEALVTPVLRWCGKQDDDISIVVARYHGDEVDYELDSHETVLSQGLL